MGISDDDEWANTATVGLKALHVSKEDGVGSTGDAIPLVQLPGIVTLSDSPPKIASRLPPDSEDDVIDPVLLSVLEQQRERLNVLKFEDKIVRFMKQTGEKRLEFPSLTSYHRLIVHRLAERFCMLHQSQITNQQDPDDLSPGGVGGGENGGLVLLKTPDSRLPRTFLIDIVNPVTPSSKGGMGSKSVTRVSPSSTPSSTGSKKVLLMRRDPKGSRASPNTTSSQRKSKQVSVAEKEKAYAEARARIFGNNLAVTPPPEGGDCVESESYNSVSRTGGNTLELERGEMGTARNDAIKGKALGGGNYCQSKGPDGTNGFGVGRGRPDAATQGGVAAGHTVEKFIKPAEGGIRSPSSLPLVRNPGSSEELERRNRPGTNPLSSSSGPKAVDAGEWLRDGKVRAKRRDLGMELDPDFRRGYDVYRPCYTPYRDAKEPVGGGMGGAGNSLLFPSHSASPDMFEQPYVGGGGLGRGVIDFGPPQQRTNYPHPYPSQPMRQYGFDGEYSAGYGSDMGLGMLHTADHQVRDDLADVH